MLTLRNIPEQFFCECGRKVLPHFRQTHMVTFWKGQYDSVSRGKGRLN